MSEVYHGAGERPCDARDVLDLAHDEPAELVHGVRLAQRVMRSPGLAPFAGDPMIPDRELATDDQAEQLVSGKSESLYHPVGTCRMGTDRMAVVDPQLRVRDIEGLRVVDASVMPRIIRGHTNSPTVMIAEKAAEMMR